MDARFELAGIGVASCGWVCAVLCRMMPVWIVTGTVNNTSDTLSLYWDGIWLKWQEPRLGDLHCHFYQSLLSLSGNFGAWKGLVNAALGLGVVPGVLYVVCLLRFPRTLKMKGAAGVGFVLTGLLMLVLMSWSSHDTNRDLVAPVSLHKDWGAALYCGWIGTVLLVVGGGVLSAWCCKKAPALQDHTRTGHVAQAEADDPVFSAHRAAFIPSPYMQTTRPV